MKGTILYFMNHVDQGGAALALYDLLVEIKRSKAHQYKLIVVTGKQNKLNDMLTTQNIENYSASFKNFLSSYRKPVFFWRIFIILRYWICKLKAIREIESKINFDLVDIIHSNLDRIDIGAYFSKKYGIPHIWHIRENAKGDFKLMSVFSNPISHMLSYPSTYISISQVVTKHWIEYGIPSSCIHLIYDGVRSECFTVSHSPQNEKLRFVFLGGYSKSKGQEFFIESLASLPPQLLHKMEVDFYGNGDTRYMSELNNYIVEKNLSGFVRLYTYNPNIYMKLPNYDVGVNCSVNEGFGRITVEYMMAGLCPLVSDTGANIEIVKNGQTGIVFKYGNISDIRDKIIFLLDNRSYLYELGKRAKNHAINMFSMRKHAEKVLSLYKEILDK